MIICKACGCQFDSGEFCPNCGSRIEPVVAQAPVYEAPVAPVQAASDPGKVKGIIALIMGILSLVNWCSCGAGIVFAIVGMILGSSGKSASEAAGFENKLAGTGKTLSTVGLILGILGIVLLIFYYVFCFVLGMSGGY